MKGAASRPLFRPRILDFLRGGYSSRDLTADLLAGVTVGLIALPLALALGIASVPAGAATPYPAPAIGIFTAIIAGFAISALGGSKFQIGGPTAAFIPVVLMIVEQHGYTGLLLATLMAGVILLLMGLARMGTLIKFIPWPVTSGFTTGIAVSIMATQAADLLGIQADTPAPREFFEKLHWIALHLGAANLPTIALSLACLALILLWPRLGLKRLPGSIVAMLAGTLLVVAFSLQEAGIATVGSKFGPDAIPSGLPPLQIPRIDFELIRSLIGPATAIALLGAIESLLSAVVADGLTGDRHDSNTELIAQGIANLVCPFFGGLPATGAIARTSANISNGGRSPVSGIVHAATLLLIVLLFAKYAVYVPMAAMGAVLIAVSLRMGEWHELVRLRQMPRSDALVLVTTFGLTVVFDLVVAVEIGMVLAAMLFIRRVSETTEVSLVTGDDLLETPEQLAQGKTIPDGVKVYRIFGPFLFGAAEKMEDAILASESLPRVLILRLHLVTAMDATALNALESVVERLEKKGGAIIISGIHRQPLQLLRQAHFIEVIGRKNFCATFDKALVRAREILEEGGPAAVISRSPRVPPSAHRAG
jgi:SulP family sulfate permease